MSGFRVFCLFVLAAMTASGIGCLGVGGLAGIGDYTPGAARSSHDFPATFHDSWAAVQQTMQELQLTAESEKFNATSGTLTSRAQNGSIIAISITTQPRPLPVDGLTTRICVRVGTFGDQATSDRILARISEHLGQQPQVARPAPATQMLPPKPADATNAWQKPADTGARPIVISPSVSGSVRSLGQ